MLQLTANEVDHLASTFNKFASMSTDGRETVGLKTPGVMFEASSSLVREISASLSMIVEADFNKQGLVKVPAGRKPLRAFEQCLKQQLYSLTMNILPEYDKRIRKSVSDIQRLKLRAYVNRVKLRVEIITGLLKKVDKELNK